MKKSLLILFPAAAIASAMIFQPLNSSGHRSATMAGTIPDDVNKIIERSCSPCHTNNGGQMAKAKLNFSVWDTYKVKVRYKKAKAACNASTSKRMPPASFVAKNPGAAMSQTDIALMCKWASELPAK